MSSKARARVRACGASRGTIARFALCGWLLTSATSAEPLERGPFRLDWTGPASCPNAAALLARIESLLGAPVTQVLVNPLTARGRVREASPERFELSLETFQSEQRFTRDMQAPTCGELGDAAALVLALAIDPKLEERLGTSALAAATAATPAGENPSATPPPPATPPPQPEPRSSNPNQVEPSASKPNQVEPSASKPNQVEPSASKPNQVEASSATQTLSFVGGAALVADWGTIAPFALGPSLSAGARLGAFELVLDATWLPVRRTLVSDDPPKGGDISLLSATLRPCGVLALPPVETGLCGAFELGDIWGTGFGTATQSTQHALWMAGGGMLFARAPLAPWLFLSLRGGLLAPLQELEFTLENVGSVHQVPTLVGRVALGAEAHFD